MLSGIRRAEAKIDSVQKGIELGALAEMRPVVMACAAAGLGLLPGALSTGIGVQAQQPLARVVVGGMITSTIHVLILVPVFFVLMKERALRRGTLREEQLKQ